MNPKDSLREEHGTIMKMLSVLQRFFVKPMSLKDGEAKDLEELIEFFEIYVDRHHHGKEEQGLFPALSRARTTDIDSLISSLLDDHCQARDYMKQIKSHAASIQSCTGVDFDEFKEVAQRFVELVRKHIRKENSEVLPLIEERLSEIERFQMSGQFHDLEEATFGLRGLETFLVGVRILYLKYYRQ
ncbi:MAG: hemerythrin domain-containing protein [Syntrophobacteraceae bacterium]|nr:hemerythrin domain-containing protein [Syntrophobacteraceae bacterium]